MSYFWLTSVKISGPLQEAINAALIPHLVFFIPVLVLVLERRFSSFYIFLFLYILVYYSCPNFPPFALLCPAHPPLSQSIPTPIHHYTLNNMFMAEYKGESKSILKQMWRVIFLIHLTYPGTLKRWQPVSMKCDSKSGPYLQKILVFCLCQG